MEKQISGVFSPLSNDYCVFFYYLCVLMFALTVFALILMGFAALKNYVWDSKYFMLLFYLGYLVLLCFVLYFQNRLLYSMCIKTLV